MPTYQERLGEIKTTIQELLLASENAVSKDDCNSMTVRSIANINIDLCKAILLLMEDKSGNEEV